MSPGHLDRYGEPLPEIDDAPQRHRCQDGWLDVDTDTIRPCPICRPELSQRLAHQRHREWNGPTR